MVTKTQAMNARHGEYFHHVELKNADGTPLRVRVTGRCKTWKTRPLEFRLPVKYGLRESTAITEDNAHEWAPGYGS